MLKSGLTKFLKFLCFELFQNLLLKSDFMNTVSIRHYLKFSQSATIFYRYILIRVFTMVGCTECDNAGLSGENNKGGTLTLPDKLDSETVREKGLEKTLTALISRLCISRQRSCC